ncbi:MAG TPA: aldose 1-epimerase [Actinomycetes bacterium]|nr:aldose 1-epimerase [Actinomycetes bacterium]
MSERGSVRAASIRVGEVDGEPAVTLAAGGLEATFLPGLGLLGTSLRHRGEELLALPGGVAGYRAGHVTGLPILAPWANRLPGRRYRAAGVEVSLEGLDLHTDPAGLPIHGTLTAHPGWRLERLSADGDRAVLAASFDYGAWPRLQAAFPFPHELAVAATLQGASLEVATRLRPTGERPVPVAFGWHPYLQLPGAPRADWRLLLPERRHLELDGRGLPTGRAEDEAAEADPVGDRTYDDLYALGDDPDRGLGLEAAGRRLLVGYGDGYGHAQVFAPPEAEFVCLEPMTGPTGALAAGTCPLVEPGDAFTARFIIRVEQA